MSEPRCRAVRMVTGTAVECGGRLLREDVLYGIGQDESMPVYHCAKCWNVTIPTVGAKLIDDAPAPPQADPVEAGLSESDPYIAAMARERAGLIQRLADAEALILKRDLSGRDVHTADESADAGAARQVYRNQYGV